MKLIVTYLMGNCEQFVDLTLQSVYDFADEILIIYDTSSKDKTKEKIDSWFKKGKITVLEREYEHDYNIKDANSRARNFYLDYLKKNYEGDWCLVLDADEIADDGIAHLKDFLKTMDENKDYLVSPRMIHFIGDLGHEDSTIETHFVLNRLFKINKDLIYPSGEHPVLNTLKPEDMIYAKLPQLILYHMAYCREMLYIRERYLNHLNKSEIHSKDYLKEWYLLHLTGQYPKRKIDINSLPKVMKDFFLMNEVKND